MMHVRQMHAHKGDGSFKIKKKRKRRRAAGSGAQRLQMIWMWRCRLPLPSPWRTLISWLPWLPCIIWYIWLIGHAVLTVCLRYTTTQCRAVLTKLKCAGYKKNTTIPLFLWTTGYSFKTFLSADVVKNDKQVTLSATLRRYWCWVEVPNSCLIKKKKDPLMASSMKQG